MRVVFYRFRCMKPEQTRKVVIMDSPFITCDALKVVIRKDCGITRDEVRYGRRSSDDLILYRQCLVSGSVVRLDDNEGIYSGSTVIVRRCHAMDCRPDAPDCTLRPFNSLYDQRECLREETREFLREETWENEKENGTESKRLSVFNKTIKRDRRARWGARSDAVNCAKRAMKREIDIDSKLKMEKDNREDMKKDKEENEIPWLMEEIEA
jgi:hypothetical protein